MNILIQAIKSPTNAFRTLEQLPFSKYWLFFLLIGMGTIYGNLLQSTSFEENLFFSPFLTFILALIFAIPAIWLLSAISALLQFPFVKLVGGNCTLISLRKSIYLSYVPDAVFLLLYVIWSFVSPSTFFIEPSDFSLAQGVGFIIVMICAIWSLIISLYALSEAASISKWRAFFSIVLLVVTLSIIVGLIAFLVFL